MSDYGIDVSSYNTVTDWTQVKAAGNSWAWAKATQGSGYTNELFPSQMRSGQDAGLRMGAYHFPDPRVSVATQVRYFVSAAKAYGAFEAGAMLPMLDLENDTADGIVWSPGGANSFIPAFRDALRAATGVQELCVYGPESWWAEGFLDPAQWVDEHVFLCVAQYSGVPGQVGWTHPRAAVHQYTDSAPTPGATRPTDRSVILPPFSLGQLVIGGGTQPSASSMEDEDDMWHFIADTTTGTGSSGGPPYTRVAQVLPDGTINGVPWASAASKDKSYDGDGTGSIMGVDTATFDDYEHWSDLRKAQLQATPGTPAQVTVNGVFPNKWVATDKGAGVIEIDGSTV